MIQQLSNRYRKFIGYSFFVIFYLSMVRPAQANDRTSGLIAIIPKGKNTDNRTLQKPLNDIGVSKYKEDKVKKANTNVTLYPNKVSRGGPTQPEMSSFKSVGADKLVNLFTGDFSYNIPLLDVGGYPINIFYNGGITMEQEASWVGLGWNINPGTINRSMRGVPDDFNGEDTLVQTQVVKPSITVGGSGSLDLELVGIKNFLDFSIGGSFGVSVNNYLGPALDLGVKGGATLKIADKVKGEKDTSDSTAFKVGIGVGANLNSRYGLTFSPNVSMTATTFKKDRGVSTGLSLSTSYNSRSGIKALQISEQMSFNFAKVKDVGTKENPKMMRGSSSISNTITSSTISFAKPSYIPSVRLPITNEAYSGRFQLGGAIYGVYASGEIEVYKQSATIEPADVVQKKPLIGYLHYEKAKLNPNAVMDFTRLNDKEVTSKTPIISAPQYSYDVFSIQGEGTGGDIRAYRNDLGYVRDNYTRSQDKSLGIGGDIGIPGHVGANVNHVKTPSSIGEWTFGNKLRDAIGFKYASQANENVYFRNPGETSVLNDLQYEKVGGTDLVRFKLGGTGENPTIEPVLERFSKFKKLIGNINLGAVNDPAYRKKRTQVISFLNAEVASYSGLDKKIKSYDIDSILSAENFLKYTEIDRISDYRKAHHISQINVTEADGKRYVYGVPVYNILQSDFTFSVDNTVTDLETGIDTVSISPDERGTDSHLLEKNSSRDGYLQIIETPAYAHSFLLSGLLSTDYIDVTGNGISEDDLGNAVKFNYSRTKHNNTWEDHKWRTPSTAEINIANFNAGNITEIKDDKGMIIYGERESWYAHSIESKTMIAIFTLESRDDGKATQSVEGGIEASSQSLRRLKKIDLYNKTDLKANGLIGARPIKTVHFEYNYSLCKNTPDNLNGQSGNNGKLTLQSIFFTFNGQNRASKDQYLFSYSNGSTGNPDYEFNAADRWGNYKPSSLNPQQLKNSNFSYSLQDKTIKTTIDQNAEAWALKKILLPSGGQIDVEYESDDYAFVQNRRAAAMMEIVGFGNSSASVSNRLYDIKNGTIVENEYVFVKVPEACSSKAEVLQKYLLGVNQLAFKIAVNMPKGVEYIISYATIEDYNVISDNPNRIWIKLHKIDGLSPLSLTTIEFLREQLPGQAFPGYDVSESSGLAQVGDVLIGMLSSLSSAFKDPVRYMRSNGMAQTVAVSKSFVRLNDPDKYKYGGGQRVKSVKLKDNWQVMTGQYTSVYGQTYNYETTEVINGIATPISSGVASYEPSIGGEENPFQTIVQVANSLPLGPTSYGALEMPVLDGFFPAPLVGYSKVTVRAVSKTIDSTQKSRSGIGKQVSEFYTAKDFPVYYDHTSLDPSSEKTSHAKSLMSFFYKYAFDSRALSQGFLIETNDMHGKMKSQASYAENDEKTPVNYTQNFYGNTGSKGLNEKFQFVYASESGAIKNGNMGIDIELMIDTREFSVKSHSLEIQGQLDLFPVLAIPVWLPFIWPVTGDCEDTYRAVTTTKVISYHSILDSIVAVDKGSQVSTRNLVYDAETGSVIVNRTNNEFDKPVYNTSYPAYWAYSGMGLAYKNINAVFGSINFLDGKITGGVIDQSILESGDELYLINPGTTPVNCGAELVSSNATILWVLDKHKNSSALTNTSPELIFIDEKGKPYTKDNVAFLIVRSGKRNMLSEQAGSATTFVNPIIPNGVNLKLAINNNSKTINCTAVEYREKWQTDNDVIKKYKLLRDSATCVSTEVVDCDGFLSKSINPFRIGLMGNFKVFKSLIYYDSRTEMNPLTQTDISKNGFINNFSLYWDFNAFSNLVPDVNNMKWVWNSQVTKVNARGLELETKDALNIYTAAQYGFSKTLPIAIINNARYNEMTNENFEDKSYDENLNNVEVDDCLIPHSLFGSMIGGAIINTDATDFSAHSGKYVLSIPPGTVQTQVKVKPKIVDSFNLHFVKDTAKSLINLGGNYEVNFARPGNVFNDLSYNFSESHPEVHILLYPTDSIYSNGSGGSNRFHYYNAGWDFYVNITEAKSYLFAFEISTSYNNNGAAVSTHSNGMSVELYTLDNQFVKSFTLSQNEFEYTTANYNVFLCPGVYRIKTSINELFSATNNGLNYTGNRYTWKCTNSTSPSYKSLTAQNGCISTIPIGAKDSMLNPIFNIPSNKKMVFSGWVKEKCDTDNGFPCFPPTYIHNQVEIGFDAGTSANVILKPSGAIIEGWQRYEGYFTAPVNASTMTMVFRNLNNQAIYFDDIRIHPYNANMRSYVYDPVNLRLKAELDANNYARFYEYDEEGGLIRTKAETKEGIKTIQETRSTRQKSVTSVQ